MDNYDRNLLLVDEEDRIVGIGKALKTHFWKHLALHRGFSVFIFNSRGELLIQKRASGKLVFPNKWANSVCSHPFANDLSYTDPLLDIKVHAIRRIEYELGIKSLKEDDLRLVARVLYKARDTEVCSRLLSGDPKPQPVMEFIEPENLSKPYVSGDFHEWEIDYVILANTDEVPNPNPEEVAEVRYVDRNAFEKAIRMLEISSWLKEISSLIEIFEIQK